MLETYAQAFDEPDRGIECLTAIAGREAWTPRDLPWDTLDFSSLPGPLRVAAAELFTQIHFGELAALNCAARLAQSLPKLDAKLFCATLVHEEARHVAWFTKLLERLECRAAVRPMVAELLQDIHASPHLEQVVAGMQFVIEGFAHGLLVEGARMLRSRRAGGPGSEVLASFETVVADWMLRTVLADEARHVEFGTRYLAQVVPELCASRRRSLEDALGRWATTISTSADDPDLFYAAGLDWSSLSANVVSQLDDGLQRCGLEFRFAPVLGSTSP